MDVSAPTQVSCPECTAQMPASAAFCPGCGCPMLTVPPARGKIGVFPETIAGALAYFTFLPAVVFLTLDPYRRNRFVRFHSLQCLLLCIVTLALAAAIRVVALILFLIPSVGALLVGVLAVCATLAVFFLWLVLVVKALQGEAFKLTVLGDIAEHYAGS